MRFGSLQEMMNLAHNVEERNLIVEKNMDDMLSKHLKTAVATKWTMAKPNGGWTRILGGTDPTRSTTLNPSIPKATDTKNAAGENRRQGGQEKILGFVLLL